MSTPGASLSGENSVSDRADLDRIFSATYEELRRLASTVRRDDPGATLSPTTLVNEAWLKLARSPEMAHTSAIHFKRIAARAMRQVLIEAARRRHASKRGGTMPLVTFDESLDASVSCAGDLIALNDSLDALEQLSPRQAAIVEGRFFGGLDVASIAQSLDISEATVLRDWRAARAWLAHDLRHGA